MKNTEIFIEGEQMAAIEKAENKDLLKLIVIVLIASFLFIYGVEVL